MESGVRNPSGVVGAPPSPESGAEYGRGIIRGGGNEAEGGSTGPSQESRAKGCDGVIKGGYIKDECDTDCNNRSLGIGWIVSAVDPLGVMLCTGPFSSGFIYSQLLINYRFILLKLYKIAIKYFY